jgi:hypothetical protein
MLPALVWRTCLGALVLLAGLIVSTPTKGNMPSLLRGSRLKAEGRLRSEMRRRLIWVVVLACVVNLGVCQV